MHSGTEDKPEVVPVAVVVHLVEVHVVGEERHDERERGDDSVPRPSQKPAASSPSGAVPTSGFGPAAHATNTAPNMMSVKTAPRVEVWGVVSYRV